MPAAHREIKLDFDGPRPSLATLQMRCARAGYRIEAMWERQSPGGKGWHVGLRVRPRPQSPVEVVALQAILGSDPWREAITLLRARCYQQTPRFARGWFNVLYAPCRERRRRERVAWGS